MLPHAVRGREQLATCGPQPNIVAQLRDQIETALNEARILILGGQVIVGVQLRIFFEGDFQRTPLAYQRMLFLGLATLLLGLAFLMAPASYHTIVEKHRDTVHLLRFTTAMLAIGLLPFAISLSTTMLVSLHKLSTERIAITAAAGSFLFCVFCWYVYPLLLRRRKQPGLGLGKLLFATREDSMKKLEETASQGQVTREVKEVLLEARMVLPGAQALLGFQFINIWLTGFDKLSQNMKLAHLASLCAVAVSTILLMMPAAYHRIAEAGEDTRRLVSVAGRLLLTAMIFLAVGVCGDFLVVAVKVQLPLAGSIALSVAMFAVFLGLWFGYTLWKRARNA
jgi:DMSO reductase anchor subunit